MPKNKALANLKRLQESVNKYAEDFNKEIPNASNFSEEYIKEQTIKNKVNLKNDIVKELGSIKNDVVLLSKEIDSKKNQILYPLLTKKLTDTTQLRGEQQITNAMLMFQANYLNGNTDYVIEQLKMAADDPDRREYFTTLLNQVTTFPIKNELFEKPLNEAMKIKAEFESKTGIVGLDEAKRINLYGDKMSDVSLNLVNKDFGGFNIPDYSNDFEFEDRMQLAQLSIASGVDVGEFAEAPSESGLGEGE